MSNDKNAWLKDLKVGDWVIVRGLEYGVPDCPYKIESVDEESIDTIDYWFHPETGQRLLGPGYISPATPEALAQIDYKILFLHEHWGFQVDPECLSNDQLQRIAAIISEPKET